VPALNDGELRLWDSLAISEWAAERFPQAQLWPADLNQRALARAAAARDALGLPLDPGRVPDEPQAARAPHAHAHHPEGRAPHRPALERTAPPGAGRALPVRPLVDRRRLSTRPVATRFRSYGILPSDYGDDGRAGEYLEALLREPEYLEWEQGALAEPD
jgi:glutathione S-transferase